MRYRPPNRTKAAKTTSRGDRWSFDANASKPKLVRRLIPTTESRLLVI